MRNAIVIAIDGLRASALGAYGNTWHPTAVLDELASQSLVLDWMWCPGPTLRMFYRACWRRAESASIVGGSRQSLIERLAAAGVDATVIADDAAVADLAGATGFERVVQVDHARPAAARTVDETQLASVFAAAAVQLEGWRTDQISPTASKARMLWLHARGFHGPWDAPQEFRDQLLDEGDPPAPTFLSPPQSLQTTDHDEQLGYRVAYAAQTTVLDECLGGLLAAIDEYELADDTLLIVAGCRGFALGEHGAIGTHAASLYSELLHIPCLIRVPRVYPPPPRSPRLSQVHAVSQALLQWFDLEASAADGRGLLEDDHSRESGDPNWLTAHGEHQERAIRTAAWMLRQPPVAVDGERGTTASAELYVKPDDRWEANEVADRCPDVAARLLALLDGVAPSESAGAADGDQSWLDLFAPLR